MSEHELDRDYSHLYDKPIEVKGYPFKTVVVHAVDYDIGITILKEDGGLFFCCRRENDGYDNIFRNTIEFLEEGIWDDRIVDKIDNICGIMDRHSKIPESKCAFNGG